MGYNFKETAKFKTNKKKYDDNYNKIFKKKDMRHCNYCSKETDTVEEDCTICGLSKVHKEENK